ncbi:MAG: AI-2E family transporter [Acidobacteriia bacterium]|nr:AI-2E family transporter [Terriglobia bacterium]
MKLDYDVWMADEASNQNASPRHSEAARTPKQHWAFNLIGIAVILGLCYWGEMVLAVMLVSVLLAFVLAPVTEAFMVLRLPRGLAAAVAVLLLLAVISGLAYYSYNQAATFLATLPKYTSQIRAEWKSLREKTATLEGLTPPEEAETGVVNVHTTTNWTDLLTRGFGSLTAALLGASFVPFLAYFMLTWQQHVRSATVMLFPFENRHTAYVTLGLISAMIRSFMVGNLLIGLFMGVASTIVFGLLHLPFFYFVGFISGFLSLIPYLGVVLAMAPPIFVGIGYMGSGDVLAVVATVFGLHLFSLNVLYPKFLGNRLQLNPLAVTMGLLLWGWLWGAMGLLLAIPITAAMKIVFDHVERLKPYGAWLGE